MACLAAKSLFIPFGYSIDDLVGWSYPLPNWDSYSPRLGTVIGELGRGSFLDFANFEPVADRSVSEC